MTASASAIVARTMILLLTLLLQITALQSQQVFEAANKMLPGVVWKQSSAATADFTCRGREEQAILGTVDSEAAGSRAILAIFVDGLDKQPQLIIDSVHIAADVQLTLSSLDYDIEEVTGSPDSGFQRSKTCKGLNLADGHTDSLHIYWDHTIRQFVWWRL